MRFFILIAAAMIRSPLAPIADVDRFFFYSLCLLAVVMDGVDFFRGPRK